MEAALHETQELIAGPNGPMMNFLNSRQAVVSQNPPQIGPHSTQNAGARGGFGEKLATSVEPMILGSGSLDGMI